MHQRHAEMRLEEGFKTFTLEFCYENKLLLSFSLTSHAAYLLFGHVRLHGALGEAEDLLVDPPLLLAEVDAVLLDALGGQLHEVLAGQRALLALGPPEETIDYY